MNEHESIEQIHLQRWWNVHEEFCVAKHSEMKRSEIERESFDVAYKRVCWY